MEDFEEENIIIVDLESKESIKDALEQFKLKIIDNDLELCSGDDYLKCFVKSVDGEPALFEEDDIEDIDFVNSVLKMTDNEELDDLDEECYASLSNIVVLTAALKYDELKPLVVEVCKEAIALVNKLGDVYDLWTDECHVFGIDLLVTLALKYPEYTYLISEYIFEDWDSEHAPYVYECIGMIKDKIGYTKDILKAVVCIRNDEMYENIFRKEKYDSEADEYSHEYPLYEHFQSNHDDYYFFKDEYIAYVKKSQVEVVKSNSVSLVEEIIRGLAPEMSKEEWKSKIFVDDTFENEVADFYKAVDDVTEKDSHRSKYEISETAKEYNAEDFKYEMESPYDVETVELKALEDFESNKAEFIKQLTSFCEDSIVKDKPRRWDASEEEQEPYKRNCELAAELIKTYVFEAAGLNKLEAVVTPMFDEYISSCLDDIIWRFPEEIKRRSLYMLARFGAEDCVYDYCSNWNGHAGGGLADKFFDLLIEIGLGVPYAFDFILKQYVRRVESEYKYSNSEFAQLFHTVYKKYDLYDALNILDENLIVFALQQIAHDSSKHEEINKFINHADRKVRDEANLLLNKYGIQK